MARRILLGESGEQGREAWVTAALEVLGAEGVDAVRVELLARRLKITKGSFYHHFRDREDLCAAMLDRWRERLVVGWIAELEQVADPRARFAAIMRLPYGLPRTDRDIELAILLWARRDPRAASAFEAAERLRIRFIGGTLVQCGAPAAEADARAAMALAFLREAPPMDEAGLAACEGVLVGGKGASHAGAPPLGELSRSD